MVHKLVRRALVGLLCSGSVRMESSSPSLSLSLISQPILPLLSHPVCLGFVVSAKKKSYRSNRKKRERARNKEKMLFNIWTSSDCLLKYCPMAVGMAVRNKGFSKTDNEISVATRQTVYLSVCWFIGLSNYPSLQTSPHSINVNNICRVSHVTL